MKQKYENAFTFIELLVAVTIFAIIAASIYYTFNAGIKIWSRGNAVIEDNQRLRVFFEVISQDARNAISNLGKDAEFNIISSWESQRISFPTLIGAFDNVAKNPELARVSYYFESSGGKVKRIQATLKDGFIEDTAEEEVLLENLKDFGFEYCYESTLTEGEYEWREEWLDEDNIPRGVKIKVVLKDELLDKERTFESIVLIPVGVLGKEE